MDVDDRSDLDWVHTRLARVLPRLRSGTVVLISAQLPGGTLARNVVTLSQLGIIKTLHWLEANGWVYETRIKQ